MSILLYHGTNRKYDVFKISEELAITKLEDLREGFGIYMTEDKNFASKCGKNVLEVEIKETDYFDSTSKKEIYNILVKIGKEVDIELENYMNVNLFIKSVVSGNIGITNLYKEICELLECNECFYNHYSDLITYEEDCLFKKIKDIYLKNIPDIIKYYDSTYNSIIYICFRNEDKLKIVNKNYK